MERVDDREKKKRKLELDWNTILSSPGPPPELVVVGGTSEARKKQQGDGAFTTLDMDCYAQMSDRELSDKIKRITSQMTTLARNLPDKGAKLQRQLQNLEEEQERRSRFACKKKADDKQKPTQSQNSYSPGGACNDFVSDAPSSQADSQSKFTTLFSQKLQKEKPDCKTRVTSNAYCSELTYLGRGNDQNTKENGSFSKKRKRESKILSRCVGRSNNEKDRASGGAQRVIGTSSFYNSHQNDNMINHLSKCKPLLLKSKDSEVQTFHNTRRKKNQTVVLVDEEDCEPMKTIQEEDEPVGRMEAKIYYPSRDDPESIELRNSDIKCLEPEAFLSSTIMNFYIRYLQRPVSVTGRTQSHYHFFNTYFYGKLKEAVSYKGNDKDTIFSKFRRWWKGVNIFEKAYIFLPIHETLHWSLVIICIPDKDDESGPVILHLDSLGFHISSQIFQNVKSFLIEEWNHLNQIAVSTNVPIAVRIWKRLPRRIEDKTITVPQQKNDYDCGIFVLYFMERFIQEAPDRLAKKDLSMFSRQWFKPEEASGLRKRIRKLLEEEFENVSIVNENENEDVNENENDDDNVNENENRDEIEIKNMDSSSTSSGNDQIGHNGDTRS